jgi:uncharacterized membrane protein
MTAPPSSVETTRLAATASLVALIVLGLGWEMAWAPVKPGGSWLALKVLPLCFALVGLLKHRMYTYRWVSLVVWLYFIEGSVRAWSDRPPGRYLALLEIALCVALFAACALHVRIRQANAKAASPLQAEAPSAPPHLPASPTLPSP